MFLIPNLLHIVCLITSQSKCSSSAWFCSKYNIKKIVSDNATKQTAVFMYVKRLFFYII
jgi:hypothetical protein